MMIQRQLPQFSDKYAILVVCGRQSGKIYLAHNGQINQDSEIKIENPRYSDREGRFETRMGGKVIRSGSVYEDQTKGTRAHEFAKDLEHKLKEYKEITKNESVDRAPEVLVYCFCPLYAEKKIHSAVERVFPIRRRIYGNFLKFNPYDLLKKVMDNENELAVNPTKTDTAKIEMPKVRIFKHRYH